MLALLMLLLQEKPADEYVAITNARVLTIAKGEIDGGTILIKNGKIEAVGKDVKIPKDAVVIEGKGLVAMPGFVNAFSPFGGSRGMGGGSTPQYLAYDEFSPTADVLERLPRTGFTSFGVYPSGGVLAGQGLVMKLNGMPKEGMVVSKSAFLRVVMRADTGTKDTIRREFDAANKIVEAQQKYDEEKKKYDEEKKKREEAEKKMTPEEKAKQPPLQEPKAPNKADPRLEILVKALKGELPMLVQVGSAADVAHFWQVMRAFSAMTPKVTFVGGSDLYVAAEALGEKKATLILRPQLTFLPFTRDRVNPAAELHRAGAKICLVPLEMFESHQSFLFHVGELVKHGLDRECALRSFTLTAAEAIGVEKTVGSLEAGKDGDVVLLTGDPFASTTRVARVLVQGRTTWEEGR